MRIPPAQLLVYRFRTDSLDGRLVGALERMEAGGALRILDVLFIASDPESGEIFAVDLHGSGAGGMVAPLVGFRLDVGERRRTTRRLLTHDPAAAELVSALGATLGRGDALAAVLVGHQWAQVLGDAVERTGGTPVTDAFVEAASLSELTDDLLSAAHGAATQR